MIKISDTGVKEYNSWGFIPVFESLHDLRVHYPNASYKTLTFTGKAINTHNPDDLIP